MSLDSDTSEKKHTLFIKVSNTWLLVRHYVMCLSCVKPFLRNKISLLFFNTKEFTLDCIKQAFFLLMNHVIDTIS